jgi:hypothetical protein
VLSSLPEVFDFARFSYISAIAEEGRVDAVINQGIMGTDAVIKIVDCWTVRGGRGDVYLGCLFRTRSFPKIISGHIDDVARPERE